jgi:hypothetical protein
MCCFTCEENSGPGPPRTAEDEEAYEGAGEVERESAG